LAPASSITEEGHRPDVWRHINAVYESEGSRQPLTKREEQADSRGKLKKLFASSISVCQAFLELIFASL